MGRTTTAVLERAARFLGDGVVSLMTDSGIENINETVDDLLAASPIRRALAQVEIPEANSMIEAFWRSLRHQWLYLHDLDSLATVRRLVDLSHRAAQRGDCPTPPSTANPRTRSTSATLRLRPNSRRAACRLARLVSTSIGRGRARYVDHQRIGRLPPEHRRSPRYTRAHVRRVSCQMSWATAVPRRSPHPPESRPAGLPDGPVSRPHARAGLGASSGPMARARRRSAGRLARRSRTGRTR